LVGIRFFDVFKHNILISIMQDAGGGRRRQEDEGRR
jgi:hypothetical protein